MAFLGEVTKEAMRTNLSVAVFPMTENHTVTDDNGTTIYVQDFDWDVKTRGILLGVFLYGFFSTHMLGGILSVKFGGTRMYGIGVAAAACFTLLTPVAAHIHFYVLVSLRILEGMCEGILGPSLELIHSRWIPLEERSTLVGIVATGLTWGAVTGMAVSSAVAYHCGWPAIFYITGGLGVVWFAAWLVLVKEDPSEEKRISRQERLYIKHSLKETQQQNSQKKSIPYLKIVTSLPLMGLFFGYLPSVCSGATLTTQLPAYIKDVLKLDTQKAGYVSSFSFIARLLIMYCTSPIVDWIINKKILTTTKARKTIMCGCLIIMAATYFLIQQATSTAAVLGCLLVINMCGGAIAVQVPVNMLDLAPSYSSVLTGLIFTGVTAFAMFVPTVIGYLTQTKTAGEWHTVFSILAGICILGAVVYGVFGSGRLQPWATDKTATTDIDLDKTRQERSGRYMS